MAWRYRFDCPECEAEFDVSGWRVMLALHMLGQGVQMACPSCHHSNWMVPRRLP
ncbi:MAG TPA: hypothetical protein VGS21_07970 [Acidimicrobiales bacterium]|nr:hypothetical protein [Acidimicrobiales bacterium]